MERGRVGERLEEQDRALRSHAWVVGLWRNADPISSRTFTRRVWDSEAYNTCSCPSSNCETLSAPSCPWTSRPPSAGCWSLPEALEAVVFDERRLQRVRAAPVG